MWEVVLAAVLGLSSSWVIDGGIRRRTRRAIREEIELADLLGEAAEAQRLRDRADAQLERYLTPLGTRLRRLHPPVRAMVALGGAMVVSSASTMVWALGRLDLSPTEQDGVSTAVATVGAIAAVAAASFTFLEHGLVPTAERFVRVTNALVHPFLAGMATVMVKVSAPLSRLISRMTFGRRGRPD